MAERAAGMILFPKDELSGDFGEILRHEVNNPLTGILGNTELLLARRDRLPPAATFDRAFSTMSLTLKVNPSVLLMPRIFASPSDAGPSSLGFGVQSRPAPSCRRSS